jgi:uncharacterized membrane protein YesL
MKIYGKEIFFSKYKKRFFISNRMEYFFKETTDLTSFNFMLIRNQRQNLLQEMSH